MTRIMTTIENVLFAGAGLCLVLMLLHVSLEVILRLFGIVSQLQTTTFVSAWYMVALVFLALPYTNRTEGHISVDLFSNALPEWLNRIKARLIDIITAVYLGFLTWLSSYEAWDKMIDGEIWETSTGYFLVWPARWTVAIGFGMLALNYTFRALSGKSAPVLTTEDQ